MQPTTLDRFQKERGRKAKEKKEGDTCLLITNFQLSSRVMLVVVEVSTALACVFILRGLRLLDSIATELSLMFSAEKEVTAILREKKAAITRRRGPAQLESRHSGIDFIRIQHIAFGEAKKGA